YHTCVSVCTFFFCLTYTVTPEFYTLSLHDALPILEALAGHVVRPVFARLVALCPVHGAGWNRCAAGRLVHHGSGAATLGGGRRDAYGRCGEPSRRVRSGPHVDSVHRRVLRHLRGRNGVHAAAHSPRAACGARGRPVGRPGRGTHPRATPVGGFR